MAGGKTSQKKKFQSQKLLHILTFAVHFKGVSREAIYMYIYATLDKLRGIRNRHLLIKQI